jgi:hypothetical protein
MAFEAEITNFILWRISHLELKATVKLTLLLKNLYLIMNFIIKLMSQVGKSMKSAEIEESFKRVFTRENK